MMWHTHAAIGAASVWLLVPFVPPSHHTSLETNIPMLVVLAASGALVPDLDAAQSKLKHLKIAGIKPFILLAIMIHRDFGHRSLWHSLYGWGIWTLFLLPLTVQIGWLPVAALSLGYASHITGDAATKSGIPVFYPKRWKWHLLPRGRVSTGSESEEVVFVLFSLLAVSLLLKNIEI